MSFSMLLYANLFKLKTHKYKDKSLRSIFRITNSLNPLSKKSTVISKVGII